MTQRSQPLANNHQQQHQQRSREKREGAPRILQTRDRTMNSRLQALILFRLATASLAFFGGKRAFLWGRRRLVHVDDLRGGGGPESLLQDAVAINETQNDTVVTTEVVSQDESEPSLSLPSGDDETSSASTLVRNGDEKMPPSTERDSSLAPLQSAQQDGTLMQPSTLDWVTNSSTVNQTQLPAWKAALPPLLQRKGDKTLQRLVLGSVEIFLLGTAHVSNDSCHDVKLLLEAVNPACIFVELCDARIPLLDGSDEDDQTTIANNETTKLSWGQRVAQIQESQGGSKWQAISTLLLTSVQEDYAETLGVELGGEFRAAHEYWKRQRQSILQQQSAYNHRRSTFPVLILGDRPLSLTLVRAWESLRWWPKIKVMVGLLWSSFSKPKPEEIRAWLESVLREESDVLTESLAELRQHFPTLHTTIIAERDAWLACKVVQTCRILSSKDSSPRARLVAIVGAGHVPGMVKMLTGQNPEYEGQTSEQILHSLCQTKKWEHDDMVQQQMIPQWVNDVTQVQDPIVDAPRSSYQP